MDDIQLICSRHSQRTIIYSCPHISYLLIYCIFHVHRRAPNVHAAYGDALLAAKYHVEKEGI